MDVVERVARALAECAGYDPDETWEEFDRNAAATALLCDGVSDDEIFPKFIRWREYEAPARAAIAAAADAIERLKGYAVHDDTCEDHGDYPGSCTCGLSKLLKEISYADDNPA